MTNTAHIANAHRQWQVRVYWEDTDAGGIVFYANYLKFFERARTEWLRTLGLQQAHMQQALGGMFVVSDTSVRYHRPSRLDDALQIYTELVVCGKATLTLKQSAWLDTDLVSEARIRIGWVNSHTLKPTRLPSALLDTLVNAPRT